MICDLRTIQDAGCRRSHKAFTHAEKWRFALTLMSHVASQGRTSQSKKPQPASLVAKGSSRSSGEPVAGPNPQSTADRDLLQPNFCIS